MKRTEMIMVIEAYSEGKVIEVSLKSADLWGISHDPIWDFNRCKYRVKPEPKYQRVQVLRGGCMPIFCSDGNFISVGAFEDAMGLLTSRGLPTSMPSDQYAVYVELLGLIN